MADETENLGFADRLFAPSEVDTTAAQSSGGSHDPGMDSHLPRQTTRRFGSFWPGLPVHFLTLSTRTPSGCKCSGLRRRPPPLIEGYVGRYRDIFINLEPTDERSPHQQDDPADLSRTSPPMKPRTLLMGSSNNSRPISFRLDLCSESSTSATPSGGLHNPNFRLAAQVQSPCSPFVTWSSPTCLSSCSRVIRRPNGRFFLRAWLDKFGETAEPKRRKTALEALSATLQEMSDKL